jgi:CelD/BcsL family acetyltransferase involved in cellulose biosynthesis
MHSAAFDAADVAATGRRAAGERPFADVAVSRDPAAVDEAWAYLEAAAQGSVYQTRRWLRPWIETVGRAGGTTPMLVVACDGAGWPVVFLPFGLVRRAGLRVASFLGGKHSNLNLGLFRPDVRWTSADVTALLRAAARAPNGGADVFLLYNQPLVWEGVANPLALLPHTPSPSFGSFGALEPEATERPSPEARKKLRKKARRLESRFGPVRIVTASDPGTAAAILDAFITQKRERLLASGLPNEFAAPGAREFLARASGERLAERDPGIELHALFAGERIVATFAGGGQGERYSGMFNSFDGDLEIARSSPGELLLLDVVRDKAAQGYRTFDLGIGEASYKDTYCDQVEPLFDTVLPMTAFGRAAGAAAAVGRRLKRGIKQNPRLWAVAGAVRKRLNAGR